MSSTELATIAPEEYLRERFIGGSDIAGVLGVSDFGDTPLAVYLRKRKEPGLQPAPKRETQPMKRGKLWEKVVGEMLLEELTRRGYTAHLLASNQRYRDKQLEFLASEIDYELAIDGIEGTVSCELKTVTPFALGRWPESDTEDAAPVGYTAQVQHGLGVTGRDFGILAALFGADELRVYPVRADAQIISGLRAAAHQLWTQHIVPGVPPPVRTIGDCDKLFRLGTGPALIADPELTHKALRLRTLGAAITAAEAEYEQLEFEMKRALGDAESLWVNGSKAVSWVPRNYSILDQERLKLEQPALHKAYVRSGKTRAFSILKGWKA